MYTDKFEITKLYSLISIKLTVNPCGLSPVIIRDLDSNKNQKKNSYRVKDVFIFMQKKEILNNLINAPGYNDQIFHIFLIKMKIARFFNPLTYRVEKLHF